MEDGIGRVDLQVAEQRAVVHLYTLRFKSVLHLVIMVAEVWLAVVNQHVPVPYK